MRSKPVLTIINNEPTFRWTITRLLETRGFVVTAHDRNTAAIDMVRDSQPAAVLLEASSGSAVTATWIVERLRSNVETRHVPIIVCSPDGRFLNSYGEYLRDQGCVVLGRPFNDAQFVELIESVANIRTRFADPVLHETANHPW